MKTVHSFLWLGGLLISLLSFQGVYAPQKQNASIMVADTAKIDAESGMVNDPNLMMVKAQCTACHSSKLILQHRFSRAGWLERIRWMQKYHKLWDLGESEKVVLDYLEKHYGPQTAVNLTNFRRAPMKEVKWYKLDQ